MRYILSLVLSLLIFIHSELKAVEAIIYNGTGSSAENKMIALTLAGIVNRDTPRLYLLNVYETWSYNQTDEKWRDIYATEGSVNFTTITDINQLVQHFSSFLNGAITYDPALTYGNFSGQNFRWQAEVAAMIGGLTNCIPLPYGNTAINIQRPDSVWVADHFHGQDSIKVSARLESAMHPWNNTELTQEQRYFLLLDWSLDNLLERCNPRNFYLREITDWAVSQRMFQMNLAGTESLNFYSLSDEKAEKIERVMQYLKNSHPNEIFHGFGWMRPEGLTQWVSAWGGSFHETLLGNLSWHHIFPVDPDFEYERPSFVASGSQLLEEKHYVVFVGSEGDAGNWVAGFQSGAWHSATRGEIPLAWGFNLYMLDKFPFIGKYYYSTATPNDGFISVTTPLGFAYPDVFPAASLPDATEKTSALMEKFNISTVHAYKHYNGAGVSMYRGIEISNNYNFNKLGDFTAATNTDLTFVFDPSLQTQQPYTNFGGLLFNHVNDGTFYGDVRDLNTASDRIISKLLYKPRPSFLLAGYQRFRQDGTAVGASNPADVTLPRLKTIMETVLNHPTMGSQIEFVTPEKFTDLLRQKLGLVNSIPTNSNDKNQLKILYAADGQRILTLQTEKPQRVLVQIFDISGKKLDSFNHELASSSDFIVLPTSNYPGGVYLVSVNANGNVLNAKFIK
jgi:hypothetical protein